jgi:pantoate--beta-alanine ligase
VGMPIFREPDGLAMSSRNTYLSAEERARALSLFCGLRAAQKRFAEGTEEAGRLLETVREALRAEDVREDYVALVDKDTLEPVQKGTASARLLVAGYVGATRLIDNVSLG